MGISFQSKFDVNRFSSSLKGLRIARARVTMVASCGQQPSPGQSLEYGSNESPSHSASPAGLESLRSPAPFLMVGVLVPGR